jgi:hypothetical protein
MSTAEAKGLRAPDTARLAHDTADLFSRTGWARSNCEIGWFFLR